MDSCPTCHRPLFSSPLPHQCPPIWKVWDPLNGDEEDAREIRAYEAETAAMTWAVLYDADNDYVALRSGATACVRGEDGALRRFRVTGEQVVEYRAREIGDSK